MCGNLDATPKLNGKHVRGLTPTSQYSARLFAADWPSGFEILDMDACPSLFHMIEGVGALPAQTANVES